MRHFRPARRRARKYLDASDATVILAMRRDDRWAWAEYFARFYPPLEAYARQAGIPRAEWHGCILDVLDDAAVEFTKEGVELPKSMMHYLVVSVRHRFLNLVRGERRRAAVYEAAASAREPHEESIVRSACSEDWLRAGHGPDEPVDPLHRGLRRLALEIAGRLSEQEWELLSFLGERVPLARIADWLGLSYEATRKRSTRLRERLRIMAVERIDAFPPEERAELERFLARVRRDGRAGTSDAGGGAA